MTRIAVCQLAGRDLAYAPSNLAACMRLVTEAGRRGAEIAVLPEGAYPGYVLGSADRARAAIAAGPEPLATFGALARRERLTLVAGIVVEAPGGLHNAAITFGPDGAVLGVTAKRFLWHFDADWFVAGDDSPVVVAAPATIGAMVCADARLPEIARTLAVRGAALICEPTAWVTSRPGEPTNSQPEFLVAARAIENGVVVAAASKCGFEGDTVAYAGRSMVVGPDGEVLVEASIDREEVVVADVDLSGLPAPPVVRRPDLYGVLTEMRLATRPAPSRLNARIAIASDPHVVGAVADVDLVVVADGDAAAVAAAAGCWVVAGETVATPHDGVVARFPAAHGGDATVTTLPPPVETPAGRLVVLPGVDALVPEQARIAMLRGAEIFAITGPPIARPVVRARAAENRVFVAAGGPGGAIVSPGGAVLADVPVGRRFLAAAGIVLADAADKCMAPGTDVLAGRQPATYAVLTESAVRSGAP
jgi:predicted amidohydrolase